MKLGFCYLDIFALITLIVVVVVMMVVHTRLNREKQEIVDAISAQYADNTISIDNREKR